MIREYRIRVRRTWRERLFSRPWRPWQTHRVEVVVVDFTPRINTALNKMGIAMADAARAFQSFGRALNNFKDEK